MSGRTANRAGALARCLSRTLVVGLFAAALSCAGCGDDSTASTVGTTVPQVTATQPGLATAASVASSPSPTDTPSATEAPAPATETPVPAATPTPVPPTVVRTVAQPPTLVPPTPTPLPPTATPVPPPPPVQVGVRDNNLFSPRNVTVPAGTTVTWTWQGTGYHDLESNSFPSDPAGLKKEGTYSYTFSRAGTYPYLCRVHEAANMRGTITVQ